MTSKEYLRQAYRLNELIDSDAEELERLRDLSFKIAGGNYGERLISSGRKEPSFVRYIDEIDEMERKIHAELCELVLLKRNITQAINRMENREERLVLTYRYLSNKHGSRFLPFSASPSAPYIAFTNRLSIIFPFRHKSWHTLPLFVRFTSAIIVA